MLTVGSLFAGIGGIELGLERTGGFRTVWQVEKDDYARRVLAKHWPAVPRYRDVRFFLGGKRWRRFRSAWHADLICGGFPCQDISNAGKRAGINGERSGLWSEFARVIRLLRPRFVLVENVAALLGRGIGRVAGDLAACGYDTEWDCIPAAAIGAPHERDRVFIIGYANGQLVQGRRAAGQQWQTRPPFGPGKNTDPGTERQPGGDECPEQAAARQPASFRYDADGLLPLPSLADGVGKGWQGRRVFAATPDRTRWLPEPGICRVVARSALVVDRLRCLGNAVVPQVAEWIGRRILESLG